ncbi:hypothetical protein [Sphingomonas sp.]|uniref:hypothetical protein n=1 Tax=Sphingomonas sp. TaxID=28214 RepID=UPI002E0D2BDC
MYARLTLMTGLALLAACDRTNDAPVEIRSAEKPGQSRLKIEADGFKADVNLPLVSMISDKMEVDGVKLFPGSKISGVDIDAKGEQEGRVTMRFEAPAPRDKVAAWFQDQFTQQRFEARTTSGGFAGTSRDGNWYTLDLKEAGGSTAGEFRLGKAQR